MAVIVHLNGQLVPAAEAKISPFDRGFVFGDGVYEGLRAFEAAGGVRIIGLAAHIRRMNAGLREAGIEWDAAAIGPASLELLRANRQGEAFVYWQVTRGTPPEDEPVRSRVPPVNSGMRPTVFGYCAPLPALASIDTPPRKKAVTCRDIRWELGHLKSISLMGNVMTALAASGRGGEEAVMLREREGRTLVTEGLATNVLAVLRSHRGVEIVTPDLRTVPILEGVTRRILLRERPEIVERPIELRELQGARELMFVGTTTLVTSIVELDGRPVGDGTPGPETRRLFKTLLEAIRDGRDDW